MKAVLQYDAGPRMRGRLAECIEPAITVVGNDDELRFRTEMQDAEMLLHVLKPVPAAVITSAPSLRLIQKVGVGVNTIDLEAARQAGVAVANMPGTNTQAVAEHTLALMLATLRRIVALDGATRAGRGWSVRPEILESTGELHGRTVGLIGYGATAQKLTKILQALGAEVVFCCRSPRPDATIRHVELDELLTISDVVSLHIPATAENKHLIDRNALRTMKAGAILVNTARGELVDELCLAEALRSGHLSGAGMDVFEDEPVREPRPLASCPTATLTPHVAWLTPETIERSLVVIVENCRRLQNGAPLLHQVD